MANLFDSTLFDTTLFDTDGAIYMGAQRAPKVQGSPWEAWGLGI